MAASMAAATRYAVLQADTTRASLFKGRALRTHPRVSHAPLVARGRKNLTISAIATSGQVAVSGPATSKALQVGVENVVLLQGFFWNASSAAPNGWWNFVRDRIGSFKDAGFTHIWLPPPSISVAPQGYMPGDWYNLNSKYGSPDDLRKLTKALNDNSIVPVADIVINHRTGDLKGPDGKYSVFVDQFPHRGASIAWDKQEITRNDDYAPGFGNWDTGDDFGGAPDLDHMSAEVQAGVIEWLSWLITDVGFGGFRFDMVKGYAGTFLEKYVRATSSPSVFNVGEYFDGDRQKVVNYIDSESGTTSAFDFPLKFILQSAIRNTSYNSLADDKNRPSGALGFWPQRSVTFLENHDTEKSRGENNYFPDNHVMTGYAYILTHPCIPTVFWPHYYDWGLGAAINVLLALRKRNNITASSKVDILTAQSDLYMAVIDNRVIVKLGPRWELGSFKPDPSQGWRLAASGTDYAIYDKTAPMFVNIPGTNMVPLL